MYYMSDMRYIYSKWSIISNVLTNHLSAKVYLVDFLSVLTCWLLWLVNLFAKFKRYHSAVAKALHAKGKLPLLV